MDTLTSILVFVVLLQSAASHSIKEHFGTSRPYEPGDRAPVSPPDNYTVVGISSVGRHGSRFPTEKTIAGFAKLHEFLASHRDKLREKWMKEWTPGFDVDQSGVLTSRGASELIGIGERMAERFGDVLQPYNPNVVVSTCTYKPRTCQSGVAFGLGAIGEAGFRVSPWAVTEDSTGRELRFFETCPAYVNKVDNNDTAFSQLDSLKATVYARIAPKIARATGLPADKLVKGNRITKMWDLCVWDTLVHSSKAGQEGWCSLFDADDAEDMELAGDLKKWIECGYGVPLSYRVAAPLLQAIVSHLDDLAAGRSHVRARLRFAHGETVVPLLALLGLYRDEVPLAEMTSRQREGRQWRMSKIGRMATNVFFLLATAGDGREPLVQVLHDESPVVLARAGCHREWCPLSAIKEGYSAELSIDFDKLCEQ
eukprot:m51a1_g6987 hypothetical protein (425) ;mRNA; r:151620-153007